MGLGSAAGIVDQNVPTGTGDTINVQAVYTDGATRYNFQNLAGSTFAMYGSSGVVYQSLGIGQAYDTVFVTGSQQETVRTWGLRGAFTHNWDPYWNTAIYGAYAGVQYGSLAKSTICSAGFFGTLAPSAGLAGCNPDFNISQLGLITRWTPVKNLTFSADVLWTHLDQKYSGTVTPAALIAVPAKPVAAYEMKDQDSVVLLLRAQRNW